MSTMMSVMLKPFSFFQDLGSKQKTECESFPHSRPRLEDFVPNSSVHQLKRSYRGTITSLNQDEGVISNEIYFSVKSFSGNEFKVGDCVQGEATKQDEFCAWRATNVYAAGEDWDKGEEFDETLTLSSVAYGELPVNVIGRVVSVLGGTLITLDSGIGCYINEDNCQFRILTGDWVCCLRDKSAGKIQSTTFCASKITPLRQKEIHGQISHIMPTYFIINGEIYCEKQLVALRVKVGERVVADVIESSRGSYNWRAICVQMDPSSNLNLRRDTWDLSPFMMKNATRELLPLNPKRDGGEMSGRADKGLWNLKRDGGKTSCEADKGLLPLDPKVDVGEMSCEADVEVDGDSEIVLNGVGSSLFVRFTLRNTSRRPVHLQEVGVLGDTKSRLVLDSSLRLPLRIEPRREVPLALCCHGDAVGTCEKVVEFLLTKNGHVRTTRKSVRVVVMTTGARRETPVRRTPLNRGRIIRGEKPCHASPFLNIKLPRVEVPPRLWEAVLGLDPRLDVAPCLGQDPLLDVAPCLGEPITFDNYVVKLSALLFLEEIAIQSQLSKFDMLCASFVPHGEFLSLEVEGLSERRPSLVVGDSVVVSPPFIAEEPFQGVKYEGVIHQVLQSHVLVKFHPEFHSRFKGEDYSVELCVNRTPLRRCHLAISLVMEQLGSAVLFPSKLRFQLPQVPLLEAEFERHAEKGKKDRVPNPLVEGGRSHGGDKSKSERPTNPLMEGGRGHGGDKSKSERPTNSLMEGGRSHRVEKGRSERPPNPLIEGRRGHGVEKGGSERPPNSLIEGGRGHGVERGEKKSGGTELQSAVVETNHFEVDSKGYCVPVVASRINRPSRGPPLAPSAPSLVWFNEDLNVEQKRAVRRILEGVTRPLPYVIFGPPGTGKTVTLVEALLQVYKRVPHSRILVVCPSNSASDLVAERTVNSGQLTTGELVRINAFNRSVENIPEALSPYCVTVVEVEKGAWHRVVVTTATTAGSLYTANLRNGHFTHVFVDEAGQLTEPETAIALGLVNSSSGQIVLAGDPKQLGPVVMSPHARKYGLGLSLLHRFCASVIYQPQRRRLQAIYADEPFLGTLGKESVSVEGTETDLVREEYEFEPRLVTLLVRSYRSHPDLLQVSSDLFYHSSIVASGHHEKVNVMLGWEKLPNPSSPLIFHPVCGEDRQEGDSPSWFNPAEAFQVVSYAMSLLKFGLSEEDIGIITPYRKQVEKMGELMRSLDVGEGVKVGSVEEFQGQERLAIILSTVRSSQHLVQSDVLHHLGFVRCAQRFNVAVTRGVALLVVVGNGDLLSKDPNWKAFIAFCAAKGAIVDTE